MDSSELMFEAIYKHFESQRSEALSVLSKGLSMDLSLIELKQTLIEKVKELEEADRCLSTLKHYFTENGLENKE
jgi:hypothetical protein